MAWIYCKKAFNMISHSWLIECLQLYGAKENTINILKDTVQLENNIYKLWRKVSRGQHQERELLRGNHYPH